MHSANASNPVPSDESMGEYWTENIPLSVSFPERHHVRNSKSRNGHECPRMSLPEVSSPHQSREPHLFPVTWSVAILIFLPIRFPLEMPPPVDCLRGWRGPMGLRERIPPQKSDPSSIGFTASQIPAPD
ncbi:hypothetical protein CDAR_381931 [Caerostris darwini]|uniref:Uncharacterized protein n=1 Tax=Caerostris darwini TaxID=1538125 RepID=A0AAV4V4V1_9ARAC|nr:hypothetical protein CDAR_381931 [Caerostris darwini]